MTLLHPDKRNNREVWTVPPQRATMYLGALMLVQSLLGLVWREQNTDAEWIRASWYGNDWITLVVAVPLLLLGTLQAARVQDPRGLGRGPGELPVWGALAVLTSAAALLLLTTPRTAFMGRHLAGSKPPTLLR